MKRALLAVILGLPFLLNAQIVINEGSNKNYSIIADEDNEYEDWIELYNAGASAVDVYNYTLTDDPAIPDKWVLPHLTIPAGGFAVIYCSGKDRYATSPFTTVLNTGTYNPVTGWNNHPFTTPFNWDGVSNIVLNVCSYYNAGYTVNSVFNQTTTAFNSTTYSFEDGSDNSCYDVSGSTVTQRPNVRFNGMTIGNGVVNNGAYDYPAPYGNWYWGARHQMLFRASELSAAGLTAGNINSLAFDVSWTSGETYTYIEYSMCSVSDNAMTADYYPLAGFKNHTNFSLSSGGEIVYLYNPAQVLQSSLNVDCGDLYDVSVGSFPNGSATIKKFQPATPEASNNGSIGYTATSFQPVFTVNSGIYTTPFNVSILDPNIPVGQIYYTIDGSEPTTSSTLYDGNPIFIYQTTVLRARAYTTGALPSVVTSATYFFNIDHITPIISVITDNANLYGGSGMFDNWGEDWLKAAHVEYYDSTNAHNLLFSQRAGIIMDGGWGGSRSLPQHSFRIKWADGVLGEGAINYVIIPDRPLRDKYSDFYLRNGSNQWLNFPYKDAAGVKMMSKGTNNYYAAWRPVSVYINGQYFGLYELREKFNTEMFKTLENADPDSTEILSLSAWYNYTLRALEGDPQHFFDDHAAYTALNPASATFWDQADQYFDMEYYTDYIIAESYIGNTDWPYNNIKIYRSNVTGQRWRFCTIDFELALAPDGWQDCTFDAIDFMQGYDANNKFINIWHKAMQNGRFKNYFINRYADVMNTAYLPTRLLSIEQGFFDQTVGEMPNEYQRWGDPWNIPTEMNDFYNRHLLYQDQLTCRSPEVRDDIQNHYGLPQQIDLTLDVYPVGAGKIHISTITPDTYPWDGIYFDGVPVKIEAIANPGYTFLHWGNNGLIADTMNIVYNDTMETNAVTFKAYFLSTLSVQEVGEDFKLYPSPTDNILNVVRTTNVGGSDCTFEIVDINGRLAMNGILDINSMQTIIQVAGLQSGIYFIRFKQDNMVTSLKFVKL